MPNPRQTVVGITGTWPLVAAGSGDEVGTTYLPNRFTPFPSQTSTTSTRTREATTGKGRKIDTRPKHHTRRGAHSPGWKRRRNAWAPLVNAGLVDCWRCGTRLRPGEPWDLGHRVDSVNGGSDDDTRPEHRHRTGDCPGNAAAGATVRRTSQRVW